MEELEDLTLSRLGLRSGGEGDQVRVVASVLGPRELDEGSLDTLADVLVDRIRKGIAAQAGDREPVGYAKATFGQSDDADCEDVQGRRGNAFVSDQRCYRMILSVAIA